jgi:uncharacterized membrane protein (DUF2068 family)
LSERISGWGLSISLCQVQLCVLFLTVIATVALIPLEVFEPVKHFTAVKVSVVGINVAVVWYLTKMLR